MERVHLDRELRDLRDRLDRMATRAITSVELGVQAFLERRADLALEVLASEGALNELQIDFDDRALRVIALQQPTARDLRLVFAAVRAKDDVERAGDHAVNLAHLSRALAGRSPNDVEPTLRRMSEIALGMLRDAVQAFLHADAALARDVLGRDDVQDHEFESVFPMMIQQMRQRPATADACVRLLLFARNLERLADHATNIAEQAIFLVEARDVRHGAPPL